MSAPRWIDKLRGFLQKDSSDPADTAGNTPAATPVESPAAVPPAAAPADPPAAHVSPPRPAPRPRPAPVPTVNSRALSELALKNIAVVGDQLLKFSKQSGHTPQPGLEHDIALLMTGYGLVFAGVKAEYPDNSQEASRLTRGQLKTALLGVLRKHYQKMNTDEMKLGANMVALVDEILTTAESAQAPRFEVLASRLTATFGASNEAFEKFLSEQFARIRPSLASAPRD